MKLSLLALLLSASFAAQAQNIAIVNGKAVPKARAETLIQQVTKNGQPRSPEMEKQVKDEVVRREILMQEAERRGIPASADFKAQMELARQAIMVRELQQSYLKTAPVSDADAQAEYDKVKAQQGGPEYRARHILVETEAEAVDLIKQLNGGAKFEDLAAKSKDPGSAARGGDLDWANASAYVPEFSQAMMALKKGEMTQNPVKSQFGYHIIRLDDTRESQFPAFADVKPQVVERLKQMRWAEFQKKLFDGAKTDYKFQ
ncbi:peptidylprolyl isomerase [Inhella proteolytica]|uniref:peptidylprolyl isomerase n=1 Tax=Inhella proteolytica TaxID=2795029 RepID=A0A931J414_9BURK|nr:peptidylprolyl isomerase [Inhella proteolytica]MBH9577886.1 peptidylprolyl isomerase [Inhella proteolytica]